MARPERIVPSDLAQSRLLNQYKNKPNIESVLLTYTSQQNDLENTFYDLLDNRSLTTSAGNQLDILGNIVGELRLGRSDDDYRKALIVRIGVNNSNGTPNELMSLLEDATESNEIRYFEHYPASYFMSTDGNVIPTDIVEIFQKASPATVNIGIMHDKNNLGWIGENVGEVDTIKIDRATFGDIGEVGSRVLVDVYTDGLGTGSVQGFAVEDYLSITQYVGSGLEKEVPIEIDLDGSPSFHFICNLSETSAPQYIAANISSNTLGREVLSTTSLWTDIDIEAFNNTSITVGNNDNSGINIALDIYSNIVLKRQENFCDIVSFNGDSSLSQVIATILNQDVGMLMVSKISGGAGNNPVFWFAGMDNTRIITNQGASDNILAWSSTTPNGQSFSVGSDAGDYDTNNSAGTYVALLLSNNPEYGTEAGSFNGNSTDFREISTSIDIGFVIVVNESTGDFFMVDTVSGTARARKWDRPSSAGTIEPAIFRSIEGNKFILSDDVRINGTGVTYRYIVVKKPVREAPPSGVIPNLNEVYSVNAYQGNASDNTINNGIDLLNNRGFLFSWPTANVSYIRHYIKDFDPAATTGLGVIGYKNWLQNNTSFTALNNLDYLSNGFSMDATSAWNSNAINYISISMREYPNLVDVVNYIGDGTARQEILHTLNKNVALLVIQSIDLGTPSTALMWFKGMPNDAALTYISTQVVGSIWGGSAPTSQMFSVGDIGGAFNMNALGRNYIAYVFADDKDAGFTAGSYVASGTEGQEVDIENKLGLFICRNGNTGAGCINTYITGTESKTFDNAIPTQGYINGININQTKVILGASNPHTNSSGVTHYWFNMADPRQN